ncbi:MAG: 3-phosphoshikimate 1-carboxyvinyltransferase [Saprospiraceae bacterium]|nr:3-phosphoshikimate 1-carboxyvinyltransferase [Saprospiraceae bacterium]
MQYTISKSNLHINGTITLNGSKSIANRALIIQALCKAPFTIHQLSNSKDTVTLKSLLEQAKQGDNVVFDAGAAGTTYRFMTAFLAMQEGTQILTGTARMKQRPIGVLVKALRQLGANIEYMEQEGYPPLKIHSPNELGKENQLIISAETSSQYISALLMIAPTLPNGLELTLEGKIVSRSYIEMTLGQMAYFGVQHVWEGNTIKVAAQDYQAQDFVVEADWSAASYFYTMAVLADDLDLQLNGLYANSFQGDAVLTTMMTAFGIETTFNPFGIRLQKSGDMPIDHFEYDFLRCPDLAQTIAVMCASMGISAKFTGLETLRIKETDRIAALQQELDKVNVIVQPFGHKGMTLEGKVNIMNQPIFDTYEDHRMAMAFAPLAMLDTIQINEPMVVVKSYPDFYSDLKLLGFEVTE